MSEAPVSNAVDTEAFEKAAGLIDKNEDVVVATTIPQFNNVTVKAKIASILCGGEGGTDDGFAATPVFEFLEEVEDTKGNPLAPGHSWSPRWPWSLIPSSDKRKRSCEIDGRAVARLLKDCGLIDEDPKVTTLIRTIPKLIGKEIYISFSTKNAGKSREDGTPIIDQKFKFSVEKPKAKTDRAGEAY